MSKTKERLSVLYIPDVDKKLIIDYRPPYSGERMSFDYFQSVKVEHTPNNQIVGLQIKNAHHYLQPYLHFLSEGVVLRKPFRWSERLSGQPLDLLKSNADIKTVQAFIAQFVVR
jgi:hypothetical protein